MSGHLETPSARVEIHFEVGDDLFQERFIVMTSLTSPLLGLLFLRGNSTISDMRQNKVNLFFFSLQLEHANNMYSNFIEPLLNPTDIMIQPVKQTVIYIESQVYTDKEVTGIIQLSPDLEDKDDLIICPALANTQNRHFTLLINNFMEHPYTLKKRCHITTFSKFSTQQAIYIKPINAASLRQILNTNHDDAIQYANALVKMPKLEKSNETY